MNYVLIGELVNQLEQKGIFTNQDIEELKQRAIEQLVERKPKGES